MAMATCKTCKEKFKRDDGRIRYCGKCRLPTNERKAKALRELRTRRAALRQWRCIECGKIVEFRQQRCAEHWNLRRAEQYRRAGQKANYNTCECGARKGKQSAFCRKCDIEVRRIANRGELNPNWKGGRIDNGLGYVGVGVGSGKQRHYRLEHRFVWEAAHGAIPRGWVVHHLNGIKSDNRLENLQAMARGHHSPRVHIDPTAYEQRIRDLEEQVRQVEARLTVSPSAP